MGEASKDLQTKERKGILDQNRPLKINDFCQKELEELAERLDISKSVLLREINLFRDILEGQNCITQDLLGIDGKLLLIELGPKIIIWARKVRKKGIKGNHNVRVATLSELVNWFWKTHIRYDLFFEEEAEKNKALRQVAELIKEKEELQREIKRSEDMLRIAQHKADQRFKEINALKHLVSAMTYSRVQEREALLKEFVGEQIGEIVNPSVWTRNL